MKRLLAHSVWKKPFLKFKNDTQQMLDALHDSNPDDTACTMDNVIGYLFAKSVESAINEIKTAALLSVSYAAHFDARQNAGAGKSLTAQPFSDGGRLCSRRAFSRRGSVTLRYRAIRSFRPEQRVRPCGRRSGDNAAGRAAGRRSRGCCRCGSRCCPC